MDIMAFVMWLLLHANPQDFRPDRAIAVPQREVPNRNPQDPHIFYLTRKV